MNDARALCYTISLIRPFGRINCSFSDCIAQLCKTETHIEPIELAKQTQKKKRQKKTKKSSRKWRIKANKWSKKREKRISFLAPRRHYLFEPKWIKIGPTRTVENGEEKEIATRRHISRMQGNDKRTNSRETKLCLYAFLVIIFSDDLLSFIDIFFECYSVQPHNAISARSGGGDGVFDAIFDPTIFREKDFDFWSRGRRGRWSIRNKCTRAQPAFCPSIVESLRPIQLRNVFMIYPFVSVCFSICDRASTKK